MIRQSRLDLFPIADRKFDSPDGPVTTRIVNSPDATPSSDQAWFMLEFSNGKKLTLVLSDAALHHDPDGAYRKRAFQIVENWLAHGGPKKIEFYGK